jgi:hypothetical protein
VNQQVQLFISSISLHQLVSELNFLMKMSPNDVIIYDYPPVFDEYEDDDWYAWKTGDVNQIRNLPKNPFMFVQVCTVAEKQAVRIRSPLDRSEFWICCSRLIDARSDRWDFRFQDFWNKL